MIPPRGLCCDLFSHASCVTILHAHVPLPFPFVIYVLLPRALGLLPTPSVLCVSILHTLGLLLVSSELCIPTLYVLCPLTRPSMCHT